MRPSIDVTSSRDEGARRLRDLGAKRSDEALDGSGRPKGAEASLSDAVVDGGEVPVGLPTEVPMEGDHALLVYHAPLDVSRVAVYLHGHCGDPGKIHSWAPLGSRYATIIALTGNQPCGQGSGRFKWGHSVRLLHERITAAVERIAELRRGVLNTERVTLIGYSQGAMRVEQLPRKYPERYPWLVLAGGPTAPHPWLLAPAEAVVVIGGQRDRTSHLRRGFRNLLAAGKLAAYMELPEARHGEFGPEGSRVMESALQWLFDDPDPPASGPAPSIPEQ